MRVFCVSCLLVSLLAGCAYSQPKPGESPATAAPSVSPSPSGSAVALNQTAVAQWFEQRGIPTQGLIVISQSADSGAASGLPMRVQFHTPVPSGELETWRLQLRTDFSAWLVQNGHPEGGCTSVDLKPEQGTLAVDIQIVCR